MERRLVVVETRFDVILPTLATKHDLELLRADLNADVSAGLDGVRRDMMTMLKWIIALIISMLIAFCGSTFAMINAIKAAPLARTAAAAPLPSSNAAPASLSR